MSNDLVERVARVIRDASELSTKRDFFQDCARAAIAVALEQAAQVADGYHRTKVVTRDLMDDGNITTTTVRSLADPLKIAAAIRALIKETDSERMHK